MRLFLTLVMLTWSSVVARAETTTILALGDSLTAGLGVEQSQAFPARLEAALRAKGHDVTIINAGVSGDTAAQGEARLDWALTDDVDAAIVELGANDALRGLPPAQAEAALTKIVDKLQAKKLPVLLAGMRAPPNLGADYVNEFEGMYLRLAARPGVVFYPFFLDGVVADAKLNQGDGIHPTAAGVDVIVSRMLPYAEKLLMQ
jgi:acyl-CoA thioesterase I